MYGSRWAQGARWVALAAWALSACGGPGAPSAGLGRNCEDRDGDGYGDYCELGTDCNDSDPTLHADCPTCSASTPEGCPCSEGEPPLSCRPDLKVAEGGALICHEGARYCRDGQWTACETAATFQIPAPADGDSLAKHLRKILPPEAGSEELSECFRSVFPVQDLLDYEPGALDETNSVNIDWAEGGGIRNEEISEEEDGPCDPSEDADCDGIPDPWDPFDDAPPFATTNEAIFLDLEPGESEDENLELAFEIGNVDVYFLVDATGSMDTALTDLLDQLTTGNYLVDNEDTENVDESMQDCVDADLDGSPDNDRKTEGIIGNISCLMADAQTGTGWFRQVPFSYDYDVGWRDGGLWGHFDEYTFEHLADISTDPEATRAAVATITTDGNGVHPEAWPSALYSVATGNELYFGWNRPAVPQRVDCGADASEHGEYVGWPCFRWSSVPVVVLITDAAGSNGPDPGDGDLYSYPERVPLDYPSDLIDELYPGSDATYHPVPYNTNEDFATAKPDGDIGTIDTLWQTQWGNTRVMSADIPASMLCGGGTTAPDAVFAFNVADAGTYTFNTRGSRFLHAMAIYRDDGTLVSDPDGIFEYDSDPANQGTPLDLGAIVPGGGRIVTGDNSEWGDGFPREMFTRCFHFNTSGGGDNGSDTAPYSEFVFEVSEETTLDFSAFTTDGGGDKFNVAMALYAGDPLEPEDCTAGVDCGGGGDPDLAGNVDLGDINGRSVRIMDADTSGAGGEMPDTLFVSYQADNPGSDCHDSGNPVSGTSEDHFYDFSVSQTTTVALETSGDNVALTTGWRETIGLLKLGEPTPLSQPDAPGDDPDDTASIPRIDGDAIVGAWWQYSGDLDSLSALVSHADLGMSSCGGASTAPDSEPEALYAFELTSPATFEFNTIGSDATTELVLAEVLSGGNSYDVDFATDLTGDGDDESDPWVIVASPGDLSGDRYTIESADLSSATDSDDLKGSSGGVACQIDRRHPDHVYSFNVPAGVGFDLEVTARSDSFQPVLGVYEDRISGNAAACTAGASNEASLTYTIASGSQRTVYILVEGENGATGEYSLEVGDVDGGGGYDVLDCAINNTASGDAQFTQSLDAGTYAIMVKGSGGTGEYNLNIVNSEEEMVGCAFHNLESNQAGSSTSKLRSYVEVELEPGDYRAVVRGVGSSGAPQDAGQYKLVVKDLERAPNSVDCHNDSLGSDRSFSAEVEPGIEYHLVMRGHDEDDSGGSGNYRVEIGSQARSEVQCHVASDAQPWVDFDEYLPAGDYVAVIKGLEIDGVAEEGWYQLTLGKESNAITEPMSYTNHTWDGSSGDSIEQALKAAGVKVIGIGIEGGNATQNAEVKAQLEAVSETTGTLDENGKPVTLMISSGELGDSSSTVLGEKIIQGVSTLSDQLSMDLSLALSNTPTNPGFGFSYVPVDAVNDGCAGVDLASDPPMHLDCRPGATPRFVLTFSNPAEPDHVPTNPDPAQEGYDLTINLLGRTHCAEMYEGGTDAEIMAACGCNDTDADPSNDCRSFLADQAPVYIVPTDVVPEIQYEPLGQYWQDFDSPGCMATERPDWDTLHYDATLPMDTAIVFEACAADDAADLDGCDYVEVAEIALDSSCLSTADCACTDHTECSTSNGFASNGYCVGNTCQVATSPLDVCETDADCGTQGECDDATGACTWSHDPGEGSVADPTIVSEAGYPIIDLGSMLRTASMNGFTNARLRVNMYASDDQTAAPTLHEWSLLYNCTPFE